MKNLVLIIATVFVFFGCAPKKQVVIKDDVIKQKEQIVTVEPKVIEPTIEEPEPIVIQDDGLNKIAVLYPSKIVGKYAKTTLNTISAFLIYNDLPFQVETFDTYDQSEEKIIAQLNEINAKGYTKVIAMFTKNIVDLLATLEETRFSRYYFPLVNRDETLVANENFIFGGISYSRQFDLLNSFSSGKNTMFYVKSSLGNKLRELYEARFTNLGLIKEIQRKTNKFKYIMNDKRMIGSTVILNTPIVKSSIILSQLTAFEVEPENILSTQLNYSPLLVKLTQPRDREKLLIASSIEEVDGFIVDYAKLLGADITYNWVDYSSLVGVNFLLNENQSELIRTQVIDNQSDYQPTLYRSTSYGFEKILLN